MIMRIFCLYSIEILSGIVVHSHFTYDNSLRIVILNESVIFKLSLYTVDILINGDVCFSIDCI